MKLLKKGVQNSFSPISSFCTPNFTYQEVQKNPVKNFSGHTTLGKGPLTLYRTRYPRLIQIESINFAEKNFIDAEMVISIKTLIGERENVGFYRLLLLPQCFQRSSL